MGLGVRELFDNNIKVHFAGSDGGEIFYAPCWQHKPNTGCFPVTSTFSSAACIMITGVFPATDAVMDNAYQTLLGQNWIFVIGSLSAYLVSQSWDVAVFHAIRDRYIAKHGSTKGGRWLWNNGSTITSQIWDTVIYAVISFGFGLGWVHTHEGRMQLIGIIIGQYLLKACLALLDTPFFYFFTRNADRR